MYRRQLLLGSTSVLAAATATRGVMAAPRARVRGANQDIRVAVVGFRDHGRVHIRAYKAMKGVRLVALCDVDQQILDKQVAELDKEGIKVQGFRDIRAVLDSKEIDVVSLATPNHWHALGTVWACQAGKDVCVEKPISHCIWEGRKMVEAARKYRRMVQADLDSRAGTRLDEVSQYLRSGQLGKIVYVRSWNYIRRTSIGRLAGPQKIPADVDYDLWTGPAPMRPLLRTRLHYDWHWQWATGNGEIANNGSHQLDQVRWILGASELPRTVVSFGGRYGYMDDGQTPNTQTAIYDFGGIPVIYEARGLTEKRGSETMDGFVGKTADGKPVVRKHEGGPRNSGQAVFCQGGYYLDGTAYDNNGKEIRRFEEGDRRGIREHFIDSVRSRKISDLRIDVLEGHRSVTVCHMGNVSFQSGEPLSFAAARQALDGNPHAAAALERMAQHLTANGVDATKDTINVGPTLTFDAKQEKFTGSHAEVANLFLKDTYREPFVIRERV